MLNIDMFKKLTILYVESDENIRVFTSEMFRLFFGKVIAVKDGIEAFNTIKNTPIDLIILEIIIAKLDGISLLKKIKEINPYLPIFILTHNKETNILLEVIKIQPSEYILKPITFEKMQLLLSKCLIEIEKINENKIHIGNGIFYNYKNKELINTSVQLTKKELYLLELFCKNKEKILEKEYLEYEIFEDNVKENSLKQLVYSLRKKISTKRIINIKDIGYKFK
jgi:two-component system, OmpR family, response regulator VanR